MYRVPPYVLRALNTVTHRRVRFEWSNDRFATVSDEFDAYDCEFTCDATSQVRWSAKASAYRPDDRVNQITTWMRAYLEIRGLRTQWWSIPMGVYRVYSMTRSGDFVDFELDGLEAIVRDHIFHVPRTFPLSKSDSRKRTVEKLLKESIPNVKIVWQADEGGEAMPKVTIDSDRWGLIDGDGDAKSITASLAADCYADRVGQFVINETPIVTNDPVWEITVDAGVKVSSATTLSRENMRNVWSVWADPGNNKKIIGPVHVWDSDPHSDTYAGSDPIKRPNRGDSSAFGVVPGRYQNPILKSTAACRKVGRRRLALSLAQRVSVKITSIFNPTLDADDCLALVPDGSTRKRGFILESVKYSIDDASTDMTMRTQGPPAFSESAEDEGL